jgi:hypothetical protein
MTPNCLADAVGAYWLMYASAGHLDEIGTIDWFMLIMLQAQWSRALIIYEDGNDREHARQEIAYTDFLLSGVELYACWDCEHWVIILPSKYFKAEVLVSQRSDATFLVNVGAAAHKTLLKPL